LIFGKHLILSEATRDFRKGIVVRIRGQKFSHEHQKIDHFGMTQTVKDMLS